MTTSSLDFDLYITLIYDFKIQSDFKKCILVMHTDNYTCPNHILYSKIKTAAYSLMIYEE